MLVVGGQGCTPGCSGSPQVATSTIAGFVDKPYIIEGQGFGEPADGASLVVEDGAGARTIEATNAAVQSWADDRIIVDLGLGAQSAVLRVLASGGQASDSVVVETYAYDWFDVRPVQFLKAPPLALAFDAARRKVWILQEFHIGTFQVLDIDTGVVEVIEMPMPPDPGPFVAAFPDTEERATQMSALGESIIVDPGGAVWLTQGGYALYSGELPNHSRVVRYDPDLPEADRFAVYNVPGDHNEIYGVTWDAGRQRIWFVQGGFDPGAKLYSFDPDDIEPDNMFAFDRSLDDQLCSSLDEGGLDEEGCYRVYDLSEPNFGPAHVRIDDDGMVWVTEFWGNAITRLDPESGAMVDIWLGPQQNEKWLSGGGPWEIRFDGAGHLLFTEFNDLTLGRLRLDEVDDDVCQARAAGQKAYPGPMNPCVELVQVLPLSTDFGVHSLDIGPEGRIWFAPQAGNVDDNDLSMGYVTPDFAEVIMLPPLKQFEAEDSAHAAGVVVDPADGTVYFAEYERARIGRLRRQP